MDSNLELFRQIQQEMGVSNSALSKLLGVSVATVEKRRAGKVRIADEVIAAMLYFRSERNGTP